MGDRFQQDSPSEPDLEAGWSFSTVSKLSIGLQIPWWVAGTIRLLLLPLNQKYIEDFHRRVVSSKETLWIRQRRKTGYVYSWHDFGLNVEKTGDVIHMYVYIYVCVYIFIYIYICIYIYTYTRMYIESTTTTLQSSFLLTSKEFINTPRLKTGLPPWINCTCPLRFVWLQNPKPGPTEGWTWPNESDI